MTLEELTFEIIAKRSLTLFDSKDLVHWAVNVLKLGYESEHLCILAGLDYDTTEAREYYFLKSVQDLNLSIEKKKDELLEQYAFLIANKAIRKEISTDHALREMLKIVSASEYDNRYTVFYEIEEDLSYLHYENSVVFNSGLTLQNHSDFILEELKIFVQMEELKIPLEERAKCYCESCKKLNTPSLKNKYQLKQPFKYVVWVCGLCRSQKLKFSNNHSVKQMIIEQYKNAINNLVVLVCCSTSYVNLAFQ